MLVRWQSRWLRWRRRFSRTEWAARHLGFAVSQEPAHAPGLLLIQIDGLARRQLERALRSGRMPFLRRLLRRRGHELHTFYSGLPASTPAVQGELHYGVRGAVPSFSFLDPEDGGSIGMMMHPSTAKRVEARLAAEHEGLLREGSSWSNIFTGGAAPEESHFCAASIGFGDSWRAIRLRLLVLVLLLKLDAVIRLLGLLALELGIGLWDAVRGVAQGNRVSRELTFLAARAAACVGLRELVTFGASIDLARGLPIVHVNFVGYDEQAHRRGPDSAFAHWSLRGIDRCIGRLHRAARRSGRRDYEVWIFSDHGQTFAHQAEREVPGGLEGLVHRHWPASQHRGAAKSTRDQWLPPPGHWLGGPRARRREARHVRAAELSAFEREEFAIAAMGPVGHIYFGRDIGPDASRRLAANLVRDGVPGVLWCDEAGAVTWLEPGGEHRLPDHAALFEVEPELQEEVARDLVTLCRHPHAGNLVILGWAPGHKSWTFAQENGAHAGPSRDEVMGFALLPAGVWLPAGTDHFIRPSSLRRAVQRLLNREKRPAAPSSPPPERERRRSRSAQLRVVTYNVHGCLGVDGRVTPHRVARLLERFDADIIAVQELDAGRERSRGEDQLALIAGELGYHFCFCPALEDGGSSYGHGMLARVPLQMIRCAGLPGSTRTRCEPRTALAIAIEWQGNRLHVIGTHLGLGTKERWRQINALLASEWLGRLNGTDPLILCGDLNLHPGSRGYRQIAGRLRDVQAHAPAHVAQRTFPSMFPVRCLDYVFVSEHFNVRAVQVPRDGLARVTSDHLPVVCDLDLV